MRIPYPGRDFPRTDREFYRTLDTSAACVAWLDRVRWGEGFVCPDCGCEDSLLTSDGRRCRGCRRRISVLAGTPLHRAHVPLPQLLEAAWMLTNPASVVNAVRFQRNAWMNRENAWTVLHKYREVMHALMLDVHLHGIVEADEVYVGGRPRVGATSKRGRGTARAAVLILVERRKDGRVLFQRLDKVDAASVAPTILAHVRRPSTIRTDGNPIYNWLGGVGYRHQAYNMKRLKVPAHLYLPAVHSVSSNTKRWMLEALNRSPKDKHLDYYLAEYAFRYNRRLARSRGVLFYRLMEATLDYGEVPQTAIVAR